LYYLSLVEHSEIIRIIFDSDVLKTILELKIHKEKVWQLPILMLLGNLSSQNNQTIKVKKIIIIYKL